jgi:hypothetical protein
MELHGCHMGGRSALCSDRAKSTPANVVVLQQRYIPT